MTSFQYMLSLPALVLMNAALALITAAQSEPSADPLPLPGLSVDAKCALKVSQVPTVFGFRLGMSMREATALFTDLPQLAGLAEQDSVALYLNDSAGEPAVRANRAQFGVRAIDVYGSYFRQHFTVGASIEELSVVRLVFLDKRLTRISLQDWRSGRWSNTDEFVSEMSRAYGFKRGWWQTEEVKPAPPDAPRGSRDFFSPATRFDCDGFQVSANCAGPPAPPGMCSLTLRDGVASKTIEKRKQEEESKSRHR